MAFHGYMGTSVAITSQEDAAVWMGSFDWEAMEFVGKGRVLHFPRNDHCQKVYCNGKTVDRCSAIMCTAIVSRAIQVYCNGKQVCCKPSLVCLSSV